MVPAYGDVTSVISIHAPREGGDCRVPAHGDGSGEFQSTPPARGATNLWPLCLPALAFQSTPPARGATLISRTVIQTIAFQSTPPARGATVPLCRSSSSSIISIHAPPRGGRLALIARSGSPLFISIHAPREGGDPLSPSGSWTNCGFQSTPPARGATRAVQRFPAHCHDFNPRPPRGGRRPPG